MLKIMQIRIMLILFDVMTRKTWGLFLSLSEPEDNLWWQQNSLIPSCFETMGVFAKRKVVSLKKTKQHSPRTPYLEVYFHTHTHTHTPTPPPHSCFYPFFYFDKIVSCVNFGNRRAWNTPKSKMLFTPNCRNRSVENSSGFWFVS